MKQRELINLPLGKYNLTDGIWDYSLNKSIATYDGRIIYTIKELCTGNDLSLFEKEEENDGIVCKRLSACVNIGGLFIHSNDLCNVFERLRFIPQSSYKETFEKIKEEINIPQSVN